MGLNILEKNNPITLIDAELTKVDAIQSAEDKYQVHLGVDYAEPKYLLSLNGVGTIPCGDIQAIKAKSKNGKSFVCSIFIASLFGCRDFGLERREEAGNIVYVDAEQNPRNTVKIKKRVHNLLGWDADTDNPQFTAYALRGVETQNRLQIVESIIKNKKPIAVFIDGVADLIENFNDVEQSTDLINSLMRISVTYDCAVVCVLHTNKAKEDNGMKGHLGTMLLQKASDVFEVKKDGDTFNVVETDCRNEPIDDFAFSIDGHGIPFKAATAGDSKELEKEAAIRKILKEVFAINEELSYGELVNAYKDSAAVSLSSAKRAVKDAKARDLLKAEFGGKYSLVK